MNRGVSAWAALVDPLRMHYRAIRSVRDVLDPHVVAACELRIDGLAGVVIACASPDSLWTDQAGGTDPWCMVFHKDRHGGPGHEVTSWPLSRLDVYPVDAPVSRMVRAGALVVDLDRQERPKQAALKPVV